MGGRRIGPSLVRLSRRIRAHVFGTEVREEVNEEFAFHVEMRIREHLSEGMTLEEARAAAVRRFGRIDEVKAVCRRLGEQRERKMMWMTWMSEMAQDVRFGIRQLRKSPGLSLAAILTLGLGIGANTAVFSVVDGVVLSPFPFPDPHELIEVRTRYLPPSGFDIDRFEISVPELVDLRRASRSFDALGIYTTGSRTVTGTEGGPQRVPTVFLDRLALEALGVEPYLGRWFTAEEDLPDVAIGLLGYDLWISRFGGDPSVVGGTITVDSRTLSVTGVMPPDFAFPGARYQLFENFGIDPTNLGNRGSHGSYGIGRLRSGTTLEEVEAESAVIHAGWAQEYEHNVAHFPIFERLSDNLVGTDVRRALLVLMGAVGLVLLIAAANVANLLMARAESRLQEVAVRTSLGASRARIVRQHLTESLVLAVLGAALGLVIGTFGLQALLRIDPTALPRAHLIGLDGSVLAFTAAVTIGAVIFFGMAPALQAGSQPAATRGRTSSRGHRRFRRYLVAAEVGLSLVVIVAAGLVGRSFQQLTQVDPGVEVDGRLVFGLSATRAAYPDAASTARFFREIQASLAALPGVTAVSGTSHPPLSGTSSRSDFLIEGRPLPEGDTPMWSAQWASVLPGYFGTMGIRATAGRLLDEGDRPETEPVVVVSQDVAERYFGGANPIGERVGFAEDSVRWYRIVGVVPRTRTNSLDAEVIPQIYFPHGQGLTSQRFTSRSMGLVLKTSVPPLTVADGVRGAVAQVDPLLPVTGLRTLHDTFEGSVARPHLLVNLLGSFAFIALLLAVVGVYGVVSYSASRRTREMAIRMALGAERSAVSQLVTAEGAWPAGLGIALGVPAALLASRTLEGILFGVSSRDPVVFIALPALLLALAVVSSWLPARRATWLDPSVALRED